MGSVFRKTYTKPLPGGAEISERGGERVARWRKGRKLLTAPVTTGADGSARVVLESPYYIAKYRDGSGVVREVSTHCRDEQAARRVLADLERKAELIRSGVITHEEDAAARHHSTPIEKHFAAFEVRQQARNVAPKYHHNVMQALRRVAADCRFGTLADLRCEPFERWLVARTGEDMSARTRNGYREAWVVFGNWCVESGRLAANPFVKLPKANVKADPRRQRRALTEDELLRLLDVARTRPLTDRLALNRGPRKGQPGAKLNEAFRARLEREGRERSLIYKTLVLTGLRKGELASLTVGQLRLDDTARIELNAADEKTRQGAVIPLRADLADDLRGWIRAKLEDIQAETLRHGRQVPTTLPVDTPLFAVPVHLARTMKRDLKAAGIPVKDERGFVVDVHALRGTFATLLAIGGTNPRIVQELMRHSDPRLTSNVYTHLRLNDTRGALDTLPGLSLAASTNSPTKSLPPLLAPNRCKRGQSGSLADTIGPSNAEESGMEVIDGSACSVNDCGPLTTAVISGPRSMSDARKVAAVGFEPTTSRL